MFASDNGQCPLAVEQEPDAYNAGMRGLKGSMYERGGHQYSAVHALGRRRHRRGPGRRRQHGEYIDLMPTVLELCGVEAPKRSFHGQSLAALARGEPAGPAWAERALVTDTQRVPRPVKWRLSCVMRGAWRLINGAALYDLATDPGQRRDVAAEHPLILAELREAYEAWWTLCERQADDAIPITLGDEGGGAHAADRSHDLRTNDQAGGSGTRARCGAATCARAIGR